MGGEYQGPRDFLLQARPWPQMPDSSLLAQRPPLYSERSLNSYLPASLTLPENNKEKYLYCLVSFWALGRKGPVLQGERGPWSS